MNHAVALEHGGPTIGDLPYAYLMSQTGAGDPVADKAEGVLLFALTEGQAPVESEVEIQSHRLRVMSVDLSGSPSEIREQWQRCVS